jgi:hypothetical protein
MRISLLFRIKSSLAILLIMPFSSLSLAEADTANPPRVQSIEILDTKVYSPGDVVRIKVNYTGGNPGLASIVVRGDCLRSPYAYEYGWYKGTSQMEWFSFFQYLNEPQGVSDQIVNAVVSNYCTNGVKSLYVTISDETRLYDDSRQRGIEKTFTVQGGQLVTRGNVLPTKLTDVIDLSGIPATLTFDALQKGNYQLPRSSKNGQIIWWTAQGACKVYVPFFLDAGGILIPTKQGTCVLQAYLFPVDLYSSPEMQSNVPFTKNNNWDYPKIGTFNVLDTALVKAAAELKAKQEAEAKAAAESSARAAELKAKLDAEAKAAVAELKAKLDAEAKAAVAELKAKQEAAANAAALKKTTITCAKGKLIKKVTAVKPKCPSGYRVKK